MKVASRNLQLTLTVIAVGWINGFLISHALSQPCVDHSITVNDLRLYRDMKDSTLYYYPPGQLELKKDLTGRPEIKLIKMAYDATGLSAEDASYFKCFVQLTVSMLPALDIKSTRTVDELKKYNPSIRLRPLPINRIEAGLSYASIGQPEMQEEIESTLSIVNPQKSPSHQYWTERTFSFSPDVYTFQVLEKGIRNQSLVLSLDYAFYARLIPEFTSAVYHIDTTGLPSEESANLFDHLKEQTENTLPEVIAEMIRKDVLPIHVDIARFPEILQAVQVNDWIQEDVAVLQFLCYDFASTPREDIYMKEVEVKAKGSGGSEVSGSVTFYAAEPDVNVAYLRFPQPVKIRQPMQYRLRTITRSGVRFISNWKTYENWYELKDISLPLDTKLAWKKEG